jgi:hypothetical protein
MLAYADVCWRMLLGIGKVYRDDSGESRSAGLDTAYSLPDEFQSYGGDSGRVTPSGIRGIRGIRQHIPAYVSVGGQRPRDSLRY